MNVQTMEMDPKIARERCIEYRRSVREHREERRRRLREEADKIHARRTQVEREEDELRVAYRAMSLGQRVLNLTSVMRAAGFDEKGLPKLAVAGSHWPECKFYAMSDVSEFYDGARIIKLPIKPPRWGLHAKSVVPPVPPRFRPRDLENYVTLWEPLWEEVPADPILLKRVSDQIYVVVAQWDLTDIERSVLEGRLR